MYPDVHFIECPEGELLRNIEEVSRATLHGIDMVNSGIDPLEEAREIKSEIREQVNDRIRAMVQEGTASVKNGLLVIDDCHLSASELVYLDKFSGENWAPQILLIVDSDTGELDDLKKVLPHTVFIVTEVNEKDVIRDIVKIRCMEQKIQITDELLEYIVKLGTENGTKYSLDLLTLCNAKLLKKNENIKIGDVKNIQDLLYC